MTVIAVVVTSSPSKPIASPTQPTRPAIAHNKPTGPAAVESGTLPWQLAAPISREVVAAGATPQRLLIAGGLDSSGSSDSGIYSLDIGTGTLNSIGNLTTATHDAAGAVVGADLFVFGGGAATTSDISQKASTTGTMVASGTLPKARADAGAVTIGSTAYVVGGYDGSALDPEVLSTTDGMTFTAVARLAVPVRYPAVAALNGKIYVFGGQNSAGVPQRSVQEITPSTHRASLIGLLPIPLTGAAAGVLGGTVYLAGGDTTGSGTSLQTTSDIFAFDIAHHSFPRAGTLRTAVANAGEAVLDNRLWLLGGETTSGTGVATVQMITPNRAFGTAGLTGAGSPFFGYHLMIADRGNDRILVLNDNDQIIWTYPSPGKPAPQGGFYFPDDAFFIRHGTGIISNQEDNETLVQIAYPSGHITWTYGHRLVKGSGPGYLNTPDDAYLLKNGNIVVADPGNCRVVVITETKRVVSQIGTPGTCAHNPPKDLGSPNGDTPLADGNILVSEINGSWIDELTLTGRLVWTVHLAIAYPSDPQQLGPDRYLVADYTDPGAIIEFNRSGQILYRYQPTTGPGVLNFPSLVEQLPSGVFMLNDDYNNRMVAIDSTTGALVWQYGVTGQAGTASGMLKIPDGFDIVSPTGVTPTHLATA